MAEGGVALDGHTQAAVDHGGTAVLGAERLVGHLEAGRGIQGAVDPHHLEMPPASRDTARPPPTLSALTDHLRKAFCELQRWS